MSRSTYQLLLDQVLRNDSEQFSKILNTHSLSHDDYWYIDVDLLVKAISLDRKDMVNNLLDKKCRVNKPFARSVNTNTPLHMVIEKFDWHDVVEKMLQLKACVTYVNPDVNTPLHLAFINNAKDQVIESLIQSYMEETSVDILNKDGLSVLHIACARSSEYTAEELVGNVGSDYSAQVKLSSNTSYAGYSPMHFAVESDKRNMIEYLIEWEADMYITSRNGSTPIHLALEKRNFKIINLLCCHDNGFENYVNEHGTTHFMAACANCNSTCMKMYLENYGSSTKSLKALLNSRVKDVPEYPNAGYTPLHFACEYGRDKIVCILIRCGAHLTLTTDKSTPFDVARRNLTSDAKDVCDVICEILQKHCDVCKKCRKLMLACEKEKMEIEAEKE